MEMSDEQNKEKLNIKNKLISEDLSKLLGALVVLFIASGLCGYIGYIFSIDNNLSISHGIIFGIIFPLGVGLLELFNCNNFFCFILYTILYIAVINYIPTFVGGIILFLLIGVIIIDFVYIKEKDRTEEVEEYYNHIKYIKEKNESRQSAEELIREYGTIKDMENSKSDTDIDYSKRNEEVYECEMCFKKISQEEYELYDCMCEDCFMDVHIDDDGNYHEEEFWDK